MQSKHRVTVNSFPQSQTLTREGNQHGSRDESRNVREATTKSERFENKPKTSHEAKQKFLSHSVDFLMYPK